LRLARWFKNFAITGYLPDAPLNLYAGQQDGSPTRLAFQSNVSPQPIDAPRIRPTGVWLLEQ
jgi:hypothetical protein